NARQVGRRRDCGLVSVGTNRKSQVDPLRGAPPSGPPTPGSTRGPPPVLPGPPQGLRAVPPLVHAPGLRPRALPGPPQGLPGPPPGPPVPNNTPNLLSSRRRLIHEVGRPRSPRLSRRPSPLRA